MSVELPPDARAFIGAARVGRLATVTPDGRLHVVPICHALEGDRLWIASEPSQKVRDLEADGRVGLAFDEYDEDWSNLRGVSISGRATIHRDGASWEHGRSLLYEKFPQYERVAPIEAGRTRLLEVELDWVSSGGL